MTPRSLRAVVVLAAGALLTACGTPTSSPHPTFDTSGGGNPTGNAQATPDLAHASAAATVASDTIVPVHPKLYTDPGNPCAAVVDNSSTGTVNPACGLQFISLGSRFVPGTSLMTQGLEPTTASIQQGVPVADGANIASAFEIGDSLRLWALAENSLNVVTALDTAGTHADQVYNIVHDAVASKSVQFTSAGRCVYPIRIRVAQADPAVSTYMQSLGWTIPGSTAVVVTYPACTPTDAGGHPLPQGVVVQFTDGTSTTILGHTHAASVVITGQVATVAPFGPVWIDSGWAPCGPAALKALCG